MAESHKAVPLKPCPFCGSEDVVTVWVKTVTCRACRASAPRDVWNRRASPATHTGDVEGLVRAFEDSIIEIDRDEAHRPTQRYAAAREALLAALRSHPSVTGDALAIADAHSAGFEAGVLAFASPMPSGQEITDEEAKAWTTYLAAALRSRPSEDVEDLVNELREAAFVTENNPHSIASDYSELMDRAAAALASRSGKGGGE